MELELARELMKLFFEAPAACGILVFEDNNYLGVILKRDIEMGIAEKRFELFENISMLKTTQLEAALFKGEPGKNLRVPVVDKTGKPIRILTWEEFQCQFYFDDYVSHYKPAAMLDNLEHPLIVTNHFKKVIYANKKAMELFERDLPGKNLTPLLKLFDLSIDGQTVRLRKKDTEFILTISHSETRQFSYLVYQLLPGAAVCR